MEEDWDMCESILEFSGKKQEDEKKKPEDNTMETSEEENKKEKISESEEKCESSSQEENPTAKTEPKSIEPKPAKPKMTTTNSDCLYHGAVHRSSFQQLLNLMRGTDMLPRKYVKRVGQAVCTCKDTKDVKVAPKFEDDHLRSLLSGMLKHFKGNDKDKVEGVVKSLLTVGVANNSVWRLYEVLSDASKGVFTRVDFTLLKRMCEEGDDKENAPPKVKEAITLPLPNQYVRHFVGRKGVHINELTKQFGIQLSIVSPQRNSYTTPDGSNAIVEVTADTQEAVDAAREGLINKAKLVTTKREKHNQRVKLHAEWVRKRWEEKRKLREERRLRSRAPIYTDIMYGTDTDGGYMKEMNRNARVSKYLQHRKTGNTLKAKPPPVLEGSTCINCLGTYDAKKNSVGSCRYHPGYLREGSAWVEFRWDCCSYMKRFTREELLQSFYFKYKTEEELRQKVEKLDHLKRYGGCNVYSYRHEGKGTVTWGSGGPIMWSCCKLELGVSEVSSKDDKHEMHVNSGCTEGLHSWRPQRNSKSSNRVKEQGKGKGKKSNRATYNMTDISKGLKKVSLNGGRKHAKQAIDELMDDWYPK